MGTPTAVRAVGGANSRNPIVLVISFIRSIVSALMPPPLQVVPCHRVIGADGSLTGTRARANTASCAS